VAVNAADLLPAERSYYRYNGSFTTPPCTEGVKWFVMSNPVELSDAQIAEFEAIYDYNYRPVQPFNERTFLVTAGLQPEELTYTVKLGDNLWTLAEKYLGSGAAFPAIARSTNKKATEDETFAYISNPDLIYPGWKLLIPSAEAAAEYLDTYAPKPSGRSSHRDHPAGHQLRGQFPEVLAGDGHLADPSGPGHQDQLPIWRPLSALGGRSPTSKL